MKAGEDWKKKRVAEYRKEMKPAPWSEEEAAEGEVSWRDVDALLVAYAVVAVTDAGAALQFTRSRDGGALGVRVYAEEQKTKTEWARPNEGVDELLYRIGDYFRELVGEEPHRWS